jgi:hypothetical protein
MARTPEWRAKYSGAERQGLTLRVVLSALVCCALCLGSATPAHAAQAAAPLVIVISSDPQAPFVRRLAAELSLFGYRVEVATRTAEDPELEAELRHWGGSALISVDASGQSAEVVVTDSAGGVKRERERLDPRRRADTNAAVLAERFRARLTELGISPAPAPVSEPAPPPSPPRPPPRAEPRLWLAAAVGVTGGGLGMMPELELELRALPVRWLSTSAFGKLTPVAAEVTAPEGDAKVRLLSVGVAIDGYPMPASSPSVKLGVAAEVVNAYMSGRAVPPYGGQDDSVLVAAAMARAGVAWRLGARAQVDLTGFIGACSPRIGVRFAGRNVADFGQPFFGASLGFGWGVF